MTKRLICFIFCLCTLLSTYSTIYAKTTYVKPYYRKDGTYVSGHTRTYGSSYSSIPLQPSYTPYPIYTAPPTQTYAPIFAPVPTYTPLSTPTPVPVYNSTANSTSVSSSTKTVNLYRGNVLVGFELASKLVYVQGYYRKDGAYVRPHYRTYPDNYISNNFSELGVSSLKPLDKYPDYTYSGVNNVQENYLLYNFINYNMPIASNKYNLVKAYAAELSDNHANTNLGYGFYVDMGFDDYFATMLNAFDKTGVLTSETYITFIVSDYLKAEGKDFNDLGYQIKELIPYYAATLDLYTEDKINKDVVVRFGKWFYSFFIQSSEINDQLDVDLLQKFTNVTHSNQYYEVESKIINSNTFYFFEIGSIIH